MNKICTTIEQSKKLIELGIDIGTADMHYSTWTILNEGEYILSPNQGETIEELQEAYGNQVIPAWSLTALLVLFDDEAGLAKEYGSWFAYDNGKSHCTKHYNNPLDAAFEMVVWLKENNKI